MSTKETTPEESGVGAIETKTNDVPCPTEVVCPRIDYVAKIGWRLLVTTDLECVDV